MNAKDIAAELWRGKYFRNSKRQCRLFEFLLENSLSEAPRELNQYIIAVEVLGRGEDFDPYSDSIVRSEISRLRKSLAIYNEKQNLYKFTIPKGRYNLDVEQKAITSPVAPEISRIDTAAPQMPPRISIPYVLIACTVLLCLSLLGLWGHNYFQTRSKTESLRAECSQSRPNLGLVFDTESLSHNSYVESLIRSSVSQYSNIEAVPDAEFCREGFAPAYTLTVKTKPFGNDHILLFEFIDLHMGETVYLNKTAFPKGHNTDDAFDIKVHAQVSKLLRPYGILARHAVTQSWHDPDYRLSYQCNIDYYDMLRSYSKDEYLKVHSCLKTAIEREKHTLDNLGIMAQMYGGQVYGTPQENDKNAQKEILKIFDDVGSDWIKSNELTIAKIFTEALNEDYSRDNLIGILYTANNHYPDNIHISLMSAIRYGFTLGAWDKALSISRRSEEIAQEEDSSSFLITMGHLLTQEKVGIIDNCKKAYSKNSFTANLLMNVCSHRIGNQNWINKTETRLAELGLADIKTRIAYIRKRRHESKLLEIMTQTWENIDPELTAKTP